MKKKGAGNIEFILAFILFVSFTAAAIYFFNPTKNVQNLESARGYVTNILLENVSVELDSYSVIIDASDNVNDLKVSISDIASDKNVRVVNYSGNEMSSKRHSNNVCFTRDNEEKFVTLYFSEDLDDGGDEACSRSTDSRIASSMSTRVISEKRFRQLKENYNASYSSLKEHFNIPAGMDFSFSLEFPGDETISAEKAVPLRREVFSDTEIKEILRNSGNLTFGYLTVKVW